MSYLLWCVALAYVGLNLWVTRKINKARYLEEDRRKTHRIFIWLLPFLGPLLIRRFWKTPTSGKLEIMTKSDRKKRSGGNTDNWQGLTGNGG
ncbi:MAG: hypothetical protein ACFB10_23290 [Salibacteraceae bacterium]